MKGRGEVSPTCFGEAGMLIIEEQWPPAGGAHLYIRAGMDASVRIRRAVGDAAIAPPPVFSHSFASHLACASSFPLFLIVA